MTTVTSFRKSVQFTVLQYLNGFTHAFFTALSAAISIKDVFRVALKESAKSAKATGKLWSERFCCVCVYV